MERAADPEHVAIVRKLYGSRAHAILNILFSFDAYFAWCYPLKDSIPLFADTPIKEARALSNMRAAIDLHEMCDRVSIRRHKSYLMHGAIFKVTSDILLVGDVWAFGTSALELLNADTKRLASDIGSKHQELSQRHDTIVPMRVRSRKGQRDSSPFQATTQPCACQP
jgi:hypothetical protein